jgi:hypothetical protein
VNAPGKSLGSHMLGAGLPLAGQRITLRLGGSVAHLLSGGIIACPIPQEARGLAHAPKTAEVTVEADTCQTTVEPGITITVLRTSRPDLLRVRRLRD